MSDPMMTDDDLRTLFTDLRVEAISGVQVPGAEAVRHTVRRRRTALAASTAGLTIMALAAMAFTVARPSPVDSPAGASVDPSATELAGGPNDAPLTEHLGDGPLDAVRLRELTERAGTALHSDAVRYQEEISRGDVFANMSFALSSRTSDNSNFSTTGAFPTARQAIPAGSYSVNVRCAGSGKVHLRLLSIPDGELGPDEGKAKAIATGQAMCTPNPAPYGLSFFVGQSTFVRLEVVATEDARERAGFAYEISRYARTPDASDESIGNVSRAYTQLLSPDLAKYAAPNSVTLEADQMVQFDLGDAPSADHLWMACAGPGTVEVSITSRPLHDAPGHKTQTTKPVACHATPVTVQIDGPLHGSVTIVFAPDAKARNHAGLAYVLPS